jgi:hypothetical protein
MSSRLRIVIVVLIPIASLIGIAFATWRASVVDEHPTDEELIQNFHEHSAEFEQLVRTARGDQNAASFMPDEYRESQQRVGIRYGITQEPHPPGSLSFSVSIVSDDDPYEYEISEKGYLYSEHAPAYTVPSLDEPAIRKAPHAYRALSGNWYLFYEFGIGKAE